MAICKILLAPESPVARLASSFTRAHSGIPINYSDCDVLGTYHYLEGRGICYTSLSFYTTSSCSSDSVPGEKGFCIVDKVLREVKEIRLHVQRREKEEEGGKGRPFYRDSA